MSRLSLKGFATLLPLVACTSSSSETPNSGPPGASTSEQQPPSFGDADGAAPVTEEKCQTLNIGIVGAPGENASANFQTWLANAGTSTKRIQTGRNDVLKSGDLASFDVVVLDHLMHDYTPAEVEFFKTWVQAGKGVVTMTGYLNSPSVDHRANVFLAPFGVSYIGEHYANGPIGDFAQHPITRGLTSVTFLGGYVVSEIDNPGGATRTLLGKIPAGNAAYAVELGQARAFVWGDEWIEFDSEWTTLPEIKQLWVQVFEWLAPTRCKLKPPA